MKASKAYYALCGAILLALWVYDGGHPALFIILAVALLLLIGFFKFCCSAVKQTVEELAEYKEDNQRRKELTIRLLNHMREADNNRLSPR